MVVGIVASVSIGTFGVAVEVALYKDALPTPLSSGVISSWMGVNVVVRVAAARRVASSMSGDRSVDEFCSNSIITTSIPRK